MKFGIGQSLKRLEDDKFLTGNGTYNDDINFQGQVYMHIVRSPFSFAKIIKIDFESVENPSKGNFNIFLRKKID